MTQNLHGCMICCQPEVICDVLSGRNVKTMEGYLVISFEVANSNGFRYIPQNHFVTAETAAEADIDDSIKRKRFRVSLNNNKIIII